MTNMVDRGCDHRDELFHTVNHCDTNMFVMAG